MGKRIVEATTGGAWSFVSELPADALAPLPESLGGAEYLDRWGDTDDPVTAVEPGETYPVQAATRFGVEEHERATRGLVAIERRDLPALGALMDASHAGYDAMGLGHAAATATRAEALARPGVHGARSSGGGCGGTVVVVCDRGALDAVDHLIR
jgi:galactokinase